MEISSADDTAVEAAISAVCDWDIVGLIWDCALGVRRVGPILPSRNQGLVTIKISVECFVSLEDLLVKS